MALDSIKTRLVGGYILLLLLLAVQIPVVYFLVGGMSEKYSQVDSAGSLRKRAVEIVSVLYQHIVSGDEELEKVFQKKKEEYGALIESMKTGAQGVPAIRDAETLQRLDAVRQRWAEMRAALDGAMESGDKLHETVSEMEKTTPEIVGRIDGLARATGRGDVAALKARVMKMSYLVEHYVRTNVTREVSRELTETVVEFEKALNGARPGLSGHNASEFKAIEDLWLKRKGLITSVVQSKDVFQGEIRGLMDNHSPKLVAAADAMTKQISENARRGAFKALLVMALTIAVSAGVVALSLWTTNKQVIKPVIKIKDTVEDFSRGDLTGRTDIKISLLGKELHDEITGLGNSVDGMAIQMSQMIGRIKDTSIQLASASEELSASATQITEGADRQSGQTAHVATAMEEMNATVIEVAKNSHEASESARKTQAIASNGGEVVKRAIAAMHEVADSTSVTAGTIRKLGKSSEDIGAIISTINDIADQTNLLALNAAIEAARAGEQGRGFAVVADEVRRLAERTTTATKEISAMIASIQDEAGKAVSAMDEGALKVENGVKLANEAGEALGRIVTGVENVTDMIGQIATSAEEQSATTDEITQNMESIAGVAKTSVEAIGEVGKATSELAELAAELQEIVEKFRINQAESQGADRPGEQSSAQKQLYLVRNNAGMKERQAS